MSARRSWLGAEAEAAAALLAELRAADYSEDDQALAVETETSLPEAVSQALAMADEAEAHCEAVEKRIEALRLRKERLKHRSERIREAVLGAVQMSGVPLPLRLPEATVSVGQAARTVKLVDGDLPIPPRFWKQEVVRTLDKRAVAEALKAGQVIPGAVLSNTRPTLVIRRS